MRPLAPAPDVPAAAHVMLIHPDSLSTTMKKWTPARSKKSAEMISKGVVGVTDCSVGTWGWDGANKVSILSPDRLCHHHRDFLKGRAIPSSDSFIAALTDS